MRSFLPVLLLITGAIGCSRPSTSPRPWTLRELEVQVVDTSREVSFTNKAAGFYITESGAPSRSAWHGWHISSVRFMADHDLRLDGATLDRSTITKAQVRPDILRRTYAVGAVESIAFFDSIDAMSISLQVDGNRSISLTPHLASANADDVIEQVRGDVVLLSHRRHPRRIESENYPAWLAVAADRPGATPSIEPARLSVPALSGSTNFLLAAGDTPEDAVALVDNLRRTAQRRLDERRERMERVLNASLFRSSNDRFDRALAWAKLSLDALAMRQGKPGIFAGLPWFSNYWGRDTFISLAGATLVTGQVEAARDILRSFASWQQTDAASPDEGRIPNLVTPTSTSYNTADGTPWFVLGVYDYVQYSGDTAFVRELYPVIHRAVEGALRHRVDRERFLTHGDAETWMDAVGPDGPWSPRGDRANDIQALWYKQLLVSTAFAEMMGDRPAAERWHQVAEELHVNFQAKFVDRQNRRIVDHLNRDGTADPSFRPNQLFALDVVVDPAVREQIFRNVTSTLVYPHGVGSLAPEDPNFHPYHQHPIFYPKDAAYHNGIVWTWLAGPWIRAAVGYSQPDLAFRVTENLVHQILDRGSVGTIAELNDAAPLAPGTEPRSSGTFSQAWSLAEFVRATYHSYLGVSVDALNGQLWLLPILPTSIRSAVFDVAVGGSRVRVSYDGDSTAGRVSVHSLEQSAPIRVLIGWPLAARRGRSASFVLQPGQRVDLTLTENEARAKAERPKEISVDTQIQSLPEFPSLDGLTLAAPRVPANVRSLRGPDHRLLTLDEIQRTSAAAVAILDATDPVDDDHGPGRFVYPKTPHLRPGSLDLTRFQASADDSLIRFTLAFRALSDPGWHPEYGAQLTFAAIALDADGRPGTGQRRIGRNAQAAMPDGMGYERILFVGGGLRLEDDRGKVLAEYRPVDEDARRPMADASNGTFNFTLPRSLFGNIPAGARWTIYVGAQDDHGGAGLGDFRSVERTAAEWHGGGRTTGTDPNVYDQLTVTMSRPSR